MTPKNELISADSHASTENTFDSIAHVSRRAFMTTAALAGAGVATLTATAQTREEILAGRQGDYASDPGPANQPLIDENPNSHMPPFTDHGNMGPIWYSFDLASRRVQNGGWTGPRVAYQQEYCRG